MESSYSAFCESPFLFCGNRACERPLEPHQFRPFNSCVAFLYPFTIHPPNPVNCRCCANQHFLGVTSTKGAGSTKRTAIYNGNAPSCGSALGSSRGSG